MIFAKLLASTTSAYSTRQIITASDASANMVFGTSISLSDNGNTIAVGSSAADSVFSDVGAIYVFEKSGGSWVEQQKLVVADRDVGDQFGRSVALSADGNTVIGGAPIESTSPYTSNGAAYVFTRSAGVWTEQTKLTASSMNTNGRFGWSVALSDDGNTALIGSTGQNTSPYTGNGAAYVFTRSAGVWTQQAVLTASDLDSNDGLGVAVALSDNGNTAVVGASAESTSPTTANGAVYVFTRSGTTWTQQGKLLASDKANNDYFGHAVAVADNGNTAFIGAFDKNGTAPLTNGAVYVFTRSGAVWTEQQKIRNVNLGLNNDFGISVAMTGDATKAMVGARANSSFYSGAASMLRVVGGVWQINHAFGPATTTNNSSYGTSVAISSDTGAVICVGDSFYNNGVANVGAVYIYT